MAHAKQTARTSTAGKSHPQSPKQQGNGRRGVVSTMRLLFDHTLFPDALVPRVIAVVLETVQLPQFSRDLAAVIVSYVHRPPMRIGDLFDCKDAYGWFVASAKDLNDHAVLVHYEGFNSRWDEWIELGSERLQPLHTHVKAVNPAARAAVLAAGQRPGSA